MTVPALCPLAKLFRPSPTEYCNIDALLLTIAQMKVNLDYLGTQSLHYYMDSLIKEVLRTLFYRTEIVIEVTRGIADYYSNSSESATTYPDCFLYINNFLILRGVEKKNRGELEDAKTQLMRPLKHVHSFGNLNYIFGYACAGECLVFCAMTPSGELSTISRIFDLESAWDRFEIMIFVINLARFFRTLIPRIPNKITKLYCPIIKYDGNMIDIRDDLVVKRIHFPIDDLKVKYYYGDFRKYTKYQSSRGG
jgi:hypothetical protein